MTLSANNIFPRIMRLLEMLNYVGEVITYGCNPRQIESFLRSKLERFWWVANPAFPEREKSFLPVDEVRMTETNWDPFEGMIASRVPWFQKQSRLRLELDEVFLLQKHNRWLSLH